MQSERKGTSTGAAWEVGELVVDRFRIKGLVRQSGTCYLYRAEDVFRQDRHLILRASPRVMGRDGWRRWFRRYCETALSVPRHPYVLAAERFSDEADVPFLLLESVEGPCWDTAVCEGYLRDLARMLEIAYQSADGLSWLHRQELVHYNFKPANVLLSDKGEAKVWKYAESDARTRAYASPEQLAGGGELGPATDVWSWAVSVLHMFVGRVAWQSGSRAPGALRRYMMNGPAVEDIPLMPGTLAELLAACFRRDPAERTITMDEVADKVEWICGTALGPREGAADLKELSDLALSLDLPEEDEEEAPQEDEDEDSTGSEFAGPRFDLNPRRGGRRKGGGGGR